MFKTNKTRFGVYGIDVKTGLSKEFTTFAYNTRCVRREILKSNPNFDVRCIYPVLNGLNHGR